jgi:hypothetical protein
MPIQTTCPCGKAYRVKDELAGKRIRCSACRAVVEVPRPQRKTEVEEETLELVLLEDDPEPGPANPAPSAAIQAEPPPLPWERAEPTQAVPPPLPPPAPRARVAELEPEPRRPRRKRRRSLGSDRYQSSGFGINPFIVSGFAIMFGAVLWFGAGFALGRILFYPPVLFLLGFITVMKGLMGYSDD